MAHELDFYIAQLRHAYKQLNAGTVKNQKEFANGLIAPIIERLEQFVSGESEKRMKNVEDGDSGGIP